MTPEQREVIAAYVRELMEHGYSRTEAQEIVDVAWHASGEAQATIARVCSRSSDALSATALAMLFTRNAMSGGMHILLEKMDREAHR